MPQIQQTAPKAPAQIGQTGGDKNTDPMTAARAAIYRQIQEIQAEKNPETKLNMISSLAQSSKQFAADTKKSITERVVSESRIPLLQERIQVEDEGGFKNLVGNVINARFGLPNTGTQLRRSMDDEVQHANKKINMEFEQNPDIVAIGALHDSHGFLATQSDLAKSSLLKRESDQIRDVNTAQAVTNQRETMKMNKDLTLLNAQTTMQMRTQERQLERQQKMEEQQQQLYDAITPEQRDIARAFSGKQPNDPTVDNFLIANVKRDKNFQAVVANADSPEGMVSLALSGNPAAAKVAVNKQAELLSGSTDPLSQKYRAAKAVATQDMRFMNKVMSTSEGYETALNLVYGPKGTDRRRKYESAIQNETSLMGPKDQLAARTNARSQLAKDALMVANKNQFIGSIASWPNETLAFVEASPIFTKLAQDKGKQNVSVQDMVTSITAIPDPAERSKQMQAFEQTMQQAANINNQAYFGFALDNLGVKMTLDQQITRSLKGDVTTGAFGLLQTFINPLKGLKEGVEGAYEALDKKYDLTNYIKGN